MKRLLKIVGLVVVVLILGVVGLFASVMLGRPPIPGGLKLDGVEVVKDGFVAAFIVDLNDHAVALVDAGNDDEAKEILAALQRRGLGKEAVKAILLTHGDADHTKGAKVFPQAMVMAMAADVDLAEGKVVRAPIGSPKPSGFKVGKVLQDGEVMAFGGTKIEVLALPGHTPGSVAYLARGVLFLGDSAETTKDGALEGCAWLFCSDRALNKQSLKQLAQKLAPRAGEVKAIAVSHSGVLQKGLAPLTEFAARP
jgi:glyoxylase-like metal-dependent hydrolase (beta-lactamase superfamily II)